MNAILSIFLCIAMLMSGASYTATPDAYSSMVTTISDVALTIDGTEYVLNPSLTFGVATENGSALFDIGMPLNDEVLFPIQAKLDDAGLSLALGQSTTAYTFSTELITSALDMGEMPAEFEMFMDSYMRLLTGVASMASKAPDEAAALAVVEKLGTLVTLTDEGEATFTVGDQELTGTLQSVSVSNEQFMEMYDVIMSLYPDVYSAYIDFFNTMLSISGVEAESFERFSDIFAFAGMEISLTGTVTSNETSADGALEMNMTVAGETITLPMNFTVHDADTVEFYMPISIVEDDAAVTLDIYAVADGNTASFTVNMPATEDNVTFGMMVSTVINEDGSVFSDCSLAVNSPEVNVAVFVAETAYPDMTGHGYIALDIFAEENSASLSFSVDTEKKEITDRIAAATATEVFNTPEDLENSTGMMMAAMGLMGDVEKLMSDESVASLIDLFTVLSEEMSASSSVAVIGGSDGPTDIWVDEDLSEYDEEEYVDEYWSDGTDDPSMLSFTLPEFGWLPEGYELTEQYVYADASDSACLYFDYVGPDKMYRPNINVDFHGIGDDSVSATYEVSADGSVQPVTDRTITVEVTDDGESIYAATSLDDCVAYLYYYGDLITAEDAVKILANLK